MRGQHYRARDKTVRKMNRGGLTEENLRSGEAVRISRREADCPALPGTADDSMNFQERRSRRAEDRKAGGRRRTGFSPDFKRPDCREDDSAQAGLYRTDGEKRDSYSEDTVLSDVYRENVQPRRSPWSGSWSIPCPMPMDMRAFGRIPSPCSTPWRRWSLSPGTPPRLWY